MAIPIRHAAASSGPPLTKSVNTSRPPAPKLAASTKPNVVKEVTVNPQVHNSDFVHYDQYTQPMDLNQYNNDYFYDYPNDFDYNSLNYLSNYSNGYYQNNASTNNANANYYQQYQPQPPPPQQEKPNENTFKRYHFWTQSQKKLFI